MVYGVFGGCYSDWYIVGYFNNRVDADKYCALHTDYYMYFLLSVHCFPNPSRVEIRYILCMCVLPFLMLFVAALVTVQKKLAEIPQEEVDSFSMHLMDSVSLFMKEKSWLVFLIAIGCMGLSFWGSCLVMKKRKGGI